LHFGISSAALLQDASDRIPPEKYLDPGRKTLFIFNLKGNGHSADPLYVFGVLQQLHDIMHWGCTAFFILDFPLKKFRFLGAQSF